MQLYLITFCFIVLDFSTGMIYAFYKKKYNSSVMREGLFHKFSSILSVVLGVIIDYAQAVVDLGFQLPVANSICAYIILMECGSIIENIGRINPNVIPAKVKSLFVKLNEKEGENDGNENY